MENEIIFLGIAFRSAGHLTWFLLSMFCLFKALIFVMQFIFSKKASIPMWLYYLCFWHGLTSLMAVGATKGGKICVDGFSPDCIWFNGMMCGIYIGLLLICYFIKHRRKSELHE